MNKYDLEKIDIEQILKSLSNVIEQNLNGPRPYEDSPGIGFILIVFPFKEKGELNRDALQTTNATDVSVLRVLENIVEELKKEQI